MLNHFKMFANYNGWANRKLYAVVAGLSEADYNKNCQVAFTSMNGTLNHLALTDLIWMSRFQGTSDVPKRLDINLHDNFADLLDARRKLDDRIIDYIEGLDDNLLAENLSYKPVTMPEKITQKLSPTLAHMFNHQTHHRGQAHAILTRLTGEAPPFDLMYYLLDVGKGKS